MKNVNIAQATTTPAGDNARLASFAGMCAACENQFIQLLSIVTLIDAVFVAQVAVLGTFTNRRWLALRPAPLPQALLCELRFPAPRAPLSTRVCWPARPFA
jgi:hypothetical protein